jgi:hypothetical protein
MRPSVVHEPFTPLNTNEHMTNDWSRCTPNPNQLRWKPFPFDEKDGAQNSVDFVDVSWLGVVG